MTDSVPECVFAGSSGQERGVGGSGWLFHQGGPWMWMCGQGHGQSGSLKVGLKTLS